MAARQAKLRPVDCSPQRERRFSMLFACSSGFSSSAATSSRTRKASCLGVGLKVKMASTTGFAKFGWEDSSASFSTINAVTSAMVSCACAASSWSATTSPMAGSRSSLEISIEAFMPSKNPSPSEPDTDICARLMSTSFSSANENVGRRGACLPSNEKPSVSASGSPSDSSASGPFRSGLVWSVCQVSCAGDVTSTSAFPSVSTCSVATSTSSSPSSPCTLSGSWGAASSGGTSRPGTGTFCEASSRGASCEASMGSVS
mmetsp:Transcript_101132/g.179522  ORF Transcript_101132/g.179522 Transcript_101132/m.179522 type:complete len:259 (-) Transcript_101132:743-1519(-)